MKKRYNACFDVTVEVSDSICDSECDYIAREVLEEAIDDLDAQETKVHKDYFVQIQGVNGIRLEPYE